ncbi:MAG: CRISPR-associated endonuclease Cas2 [Patescibacteria group bacterium]
MTIRTKDTTAAIIDGILKFVAAGGFITTIVIAPNAVQIFDKPLNKLIKGLDKRQRERELRRIMGYMKQKGLIKYDSHDYGHGIKLTKAGRDRLRKSNFENMEIPYQTRWDKMWRLVFFDIPEKERAKRNSLNLKLKQLGFRQLQISIWVYPFPCRAEIEAVCHVLEIRHYVTLIEIAKIDNEELLRARFKQLLKTS